MAKRKTIAPLSERIFAAVIDIPQSLNDVASTVGCTFADVLAEFYKDGWDQRYRLIDPPSNAGRYRPIMVVRAVTQSPHQQQSQP